jgi:CRP/FNR family transcriptional regulator, cyclic AMP receptor protein
VASDRNELLRSVPLFSDFDDRELASISGTLRERTFSAGEAVVTEGTPGIGFFVILEGEASVDVHGQDRGRLGAGDYFGEIALIAESERTATVTAATDLRCLSLSSWEFRPLVSANGTLAWKLLQALTRKLPAHEQHPG